MYVSQSASAQQLLHLVSTQDQCAITAQLAIKTFVRNHSCVGVFAWVYVCKKGMDREKLCVCARAHAHVCVCMSKKRECEKMFVMYSQIVCVCVCACVRAWRRRRGELDEAGERE